MDPFMIIIIAGGVLMIALFVVMYFVDRTVQKRQQQPKT